MTHEIELDNDQLKAVRKLGGLNVYQAEMLGITPSDIESLREFFLSVETVYEEALLDGEIE